MTKIILTRHGHVEGINPARFRGCTELPSELGQAQARAVAARIAKTWNPVKVYTSPMGRCVEIARACRVASEPIEALNDLDYGQWQWRTTTRSGPLGQSSLPLGVRRRISCVSPEVILFRTL
jgi:broad specificity phosphatase PhoE